MLLYEEKKSKMPLKQQKTKATKKYRVKYAFRVHICMKQQGSSSLTSLYKKKFSVIFRKIFHLRVNEKTENFFFMFETKVQYSILNLV